MAAERVGQADVGAAAALLVAGVPADVADEEVEQAVVVVVEEDGAGGMAGVVHAGFPGDVPKVSAPVVFEEEVAAADGRDEEVLVAVVVGVREGGRDAHAVRQGHARLARDVPEAAVPDVLPELVAAELVDEVDVDETVAVHVGRGDPVAVVVVDGLVEQARVVHDPVQKRDAALLLPVREPEAVKDAELPGRRELGLAPFGERQDADVRIGIENSDRRARGARGRHEGQERGRREQPSPAFC